MVIQEAASSMLCFAPSLDVSNLSPVQYGHSLLHFSWITTAKLVNFSSTARFLPSFTNNYFSIPNLDPYWPGSAIQTANWIQTKQKHHLKLQTRRHGPRRHGWESCRCCWRTRVSFLQLISIRLYITWSSRDPLPFGSHQYHRLRNIYTIFSTFPWAL